MFAFIARFHTFFLSWSNCIFLAFYSSFSYSILFLVVLYSALDRIAQRSPPIEFATTLCRVRSHTFQVRPHQVEFAP